MFNPRIMDSLESKFIDLLAMKGCKRDLKRMKNFQTIDKTS